MTDDQSTVRAFAAVKLESTVLDKIASLSTQIRKQLTSRAIRWVKTEQIHLTLRFYGNIASSEIQELLKALHPISSGTGSLTLKLGNLGCFPDFHNPRIVWLGLIGDIIPLQHIQRKVVELSENLGEPADAKEFKPHLTLARIKDAPRKEAQSIGDYLRSCNLHVSAEWIVDRIYLIQSELTPQGPIYTDLGCIPLNLAS